MGPELIAVLAGAQWLVSLRLYALLGPPPKRLGVLSSSALLPRISIIIPARNEAENLPRLLGSIPKGGPLEIIVVDDDSSDGTGEVAEKLGARVVRSSGPPAGWIGKTWACAKGAEAAQSELLLFLDADCWFEQDGYDRLLDCYPGGAWSVVPWHWVERPHEQLSAFFNLTMSAANLGRELFGQYLLVRKKDYIAVGGHEGVKDCILENVALGAKLRAAGTLVSSFPGRGMLSFRMYPEGVEALTAGWSKGFAKGASGTAPDRMVLIAIWIAGLCAVFGGCFVAPWWFGPLYLAYAALLWAMLRRTGRFSWLTALLYPVPLVFYHFVLFRALLGGSRNVTWKGRRVDDA